MPVSETLVSLDENDLLNGGTNTESQYALAALDGTWKLYPLVLIKSPFEV